MTISIISPDLSWLHEVHDPIAMIDGHSVSRAFHLPPGVLASLDGKERYEILEDDFNVAIASVNGIDYNIGAAVAVRGDLGNGHVKLVHPPHVYAWVAQMFFTTRNLTAVRTMPLDALVRSCADLPPPVLSRCPRCRGKMREPDAEALVGVHATLMDGPDTRGCVSTQPCTRCNGNGRIADFSAGDDKLGPITVNRYALATIVPHLRGNEIALCLAPSLDIEGGLDCHVRPYNVHDREHRVGGDWRVLWPAVEPEAAVPGEAGVVSVAVA